MHDEWVVPFCDQVVRDVGGRPLAVYVGFPVKILGDASVRDDDHGCRAQLEREEAAVQSTPFGKLEFHSSALEGREKETPGLLAC